MPKDNLLSIVIPPEVATTVLNAINDISTQLKPYVIALSMEERKALPKLGNKTIPFVEKVIEYADTEPQFIPPYLDLAELKRDYAAVNTLNLFHRPLNEIISNISDTLMEEGSDSYRNSLKYYESVKTVAKNDVPNAKTIYEDLKKRFENQGKRVEPTTKKDE